jgi:replication factor C subunit 2/4
LLFYGPPGTGKTSTILALAKDLYGSEVSSPRPLVCRALRSSSNMRGVRPLLRPLTHRVRAQLYKSRVLELNASDERGIEVVRTKIKHFASLSVSTNRSTSNTVPPFKLIVLDEADCMTDDAQSALRRTMETYSRVTRFCIVCNYVSRIIGPIASRCAKFRFQPLPEAVMSGRLQHIAKAEGFELSAAACNALRAVSGGDMRRAITLMQNSHVLLGSAITAEAITSAAAVVPDEEIDGLVKACRTNTFDQVQGKVTDLIASGYPANQIVQQLLDWVVRKDSNLLSPSGKAIVCRQLAATDKCLVDGADETLQLLHVAAVTMQAMQAA